MFAAIRIRGSINLKPKIKKTLELLCLSKANQLVLVPERQLPMLKKAEAYITWGEIEEKTLKQLLEKRGRILGDKKISQEFLKKQGFNSTKKLVETVLQEKTKLKKIGIKQVFRLRPPRKGFGKQGIKKPYSIGGALGYRATDINELIKRMI